VPYLVLGGTLKLEDKYKQHNTKAQDLKRIIKTRIDNQEDMEDRITTQGEAINLVVVIVEDLEEVAVAVLDPVECIVQEEAIALEGAIV